MLQIEIHPNRPLTIITKYNTKKQAAKTKTHTHHKNNNNKIKREKDLIHEKIKSLK